MCLSSDRSIHLMILLYLPCIISAANSLSCYFPPNTQRSEDVNCHLSHAKITYFDNDKLSCHGMQLDGVTVIACSSCDSMADSLKAFLPNDTVIANSLKSIDLPSYRGRACVLSHTDQQGPQLSPAIDEEVVVHGEVTVPLCDVQFVWIYGAAICQCTDCEPSSILENAVTTYSSMQAALSRGHQQQNRRSRMIRSVDESTPTAQATLASVTSARESTASPTSPAIVEIKYDHDTTEAPSVPAPPEITLLPSNKSSTSSSQSPLSPVEIPSNDLTTTDVNDTTADFLSTSTSIDTSTSGFSSTLSTTSTKRIKSTSASYTRKAKEAKEVARFRARLEVAATRDRLVLDLFGTAVCTIFALPIPVVVTTIVFNLCMDSRRTKV